MRLKLFVSEKDMLVDEMFSSLSNANIQVVGPEIIFGKIYDKIGFNRIKEELCKHLVIARLSFPLSNLKTLDYLYRYQGISLSIGKVYRFVRQTEQSLKNRSSADNIWAYKTNIRWSNKCSILRYDDPIF